MLEHGDVVLALVVDRPSSGAALDVLVRLGLVTSFSAFVHVEGAMLVTTWCSVLFGNRELLLVGRLQNLRLSLSLL